MGSGITFAINRFVCVQLQIASLKQQQHLAMIILGCDAMRILLPLPSCRASSHEILCKLGHDFRDKRFHEHFLLLPQPIAMQGIRLFLEIRIFVVQTKMLPFHKSVVGCSFSVQDVFPWQHQCFFKGNQIL